MFFPKKKRTNFLSVSRSYGKGLQKKAWYWKTEAFSKRIAAGTIPRDIKN